MEMGESVIGPGTGGDDGHPEDCVFCAESPLQLKGYKTKHGSLLNADELEKSLRSNSQEMITKDSEGDYSIYPLPGGGDPTTGWVAKAGALEDFEVEIDATAHHIIPGNGAMAKSSLEKWTRADKGKIKEDIGYSIDCANNGIFLPRLPAIYGRKFKLPEKVPMYEYYGQKWSDLSNSSKQSTGNLIMHDTWLQMHYTNHRARYDPGAPLSYDTEAKNICNEIGHLAGNFHTVCERSKDGDGKHFPPYALVHLINQKSDCLKIRITGRPDRWKSWVSPLARGLTRALVEGKEKLSTKVLISRKHGK